MTSESAHMPAEDSGAGIEMKPVNIHYEEIVAGGTTVRQFEIAGEPGSTTAADTSLAPTTSPYGYVSGYQLIDMAPFEKQYKPDTFDWKALNHKTRKYYLTQNELIEGFREARKLNEDADPDAQKKVIEENSRIDKIVTYASGVGNVILLCSLVVAFAFSGAISLIASLMDAALDNLSIVVILVTSYMRHRVDPYKYPQGKERLEPVGVMIFSCIMATASLILIVESLQKLATDPYNPPDASIISIVLIAADLGMKAMLFVLCQRYASRSGVAAALTQDHRNDLVLNGTALVCTIIGAHYWAPTDPIGAILISLYTGHSWITTAFEQVELLTGATAEPDFIKKLTFICMNHDDRILAVDTVRAFRFGTRFLVELDIVLPKDMPLKDAHNIGEALQVKAERLEDVERCFVHLDYEYSHNPNSEHKQWGGDKGDQS